MLVALQLQIKAQKLGFILAGAGSAVGLGNIWRFPTTTGEYGGAAFVIIYLISVVFICLAVMIAELALGRHAEKNPVEYLKKEIFSIFSLYHMESNLKKYNIPSSAVPEIARRSSSSSMFGNPVELSMAEREKLLRKII